MRRAGHQPYDRCMKHPYLTIFSTLTALSFIIMLAATALWMYVPSRIVYQESSPVRTKGYSIEVREHGHSHFLTPRQ